MESDAVYIFNCFVSGFFVAQGCTIFVYTQKKLKRTVKLINVISYASKTKKIKSNYNKILRVFCTYYVYICGHKKTF